MQSVAFKEVFVMSKKEVKNWERPMSAPSVRLKIILYGIIKFDDPWVYHNFFFGGGVFGKLKLDFFSAKIVKLSKPTGRGSKRIGWWSDHIKNVQNTHKLKHIEKSGVSPKQFKKRKKN